MKILCETAKHGEEGTSDEWNLASEMILERLNTSRTQGGGEEKKEREREQCISLPLRFFLFLPLL